jgi:hypothetical protein
VRSILFLPVYYTTSLVISAGRTRIQIEGLDILLTTKRIKIF